MTHRQRKPLTRKRKLLFFGMTLVVSLVLALIAFFAGDTYLHRRHDTAPNRAGYRGKIAGKKRPGEIRLVLLGGSCAYGYGVTNDQTISAYLERELSARAKRPVSVVNLAYNNQGAYSFLPTLIDYEKLDYDGVILYEGYNDLGGENRSSYRRDSPMFTAFGYYPVLPMILSEKIATMRYGDLDKAYREGKVTFRPREVPASVQERQRRIEESLARSSAASASVRSTGECGRWSFYCDCMQVAVQYARAKHRTVWVATQPYFSDKHRDQQAMMSAMLARHFDTDVTYINLGDAVSLKDPSMTYDTMHLTPPGNEIIARHLADVIAPSLR